MHTRNLNARHRAMTNRVEALGVALGRLTLILQGSTEPWMLRDMPNVMAAKARIARIEQLLICNALKTLEALHNICVDELSRSVDRGERRRRLRRNLQAIDRARSSILALLNDRDPLSPTQHCGATAPPERDVRLTSDARPRSL